jgi:hypothetical protein
MNISLYMTLMIIKWGITIIQLIRDNLIHELWINICTKPINTLYSIYILYKLINRRTQSSFWLEFIVYIFIVMNHWGPKRTLWIQHKTRKNGDACVTFEFAWYIKDNLNYVIKLLSLFPFSLYLRVLQVFKPFNCF